MPTAIVTGASRGLGLALARALAERRWRLVIDAREAGTLNEVATELARSTDVAALAGDVSDPEHRASLIAATGDQIDVEMDVGPISTDCVYLSEVLGTGAFARGQIGDETISVPLTFNSDEVYDNGTLTLNRVN